MSSAEHNRRSDQGASSPSRTTRFLMGRICGVPIAAVLWFVVGLAFMAKGFIGDEPTDTTNGLVCFGISIVVCGQQA